MSVLDLMLYDDAFDIQMPASRPKKITRSEHDEQRSLFSWAAVMRNQYPDLEWMFAVPNAAKRSFQLANYMKSEGVKSGVPDIFLLVARGHHHGLAIEMKRSTKTTDAQKAWLAALEQRGYRTAVCWSFEDARDTILTYLRQ